MTDFRAAYWFSKMGTDTQPLDLTVKKSVGIRGDCLFGEVFREKPCLDFFFFLFTCLVGLICLKGLEQREVWKERERATKVYSLVYFPSIHGGQARPGWARNQDLYLGFPGEW